MKTMPKQSANSLVKVIHLSLLALVLSATQCVWALGNALNGQKLYPTCFGCHDISKGEQKILNAAGSKFDQGVPAAITTGIIKNPGDMGKYATGGTKALSVTDLADIAAYINAVNWDNCLAAPGTSGVTGKTGATCSTSTTGDTTLPVNSCVAQTMSWTVGGVICDSTVPVTSIGSGLTAKDATTPSTGSANYTCGANGVWSTPSSASCTLPPPANCAATALTWTVGTYSCNASAAPVLTDNGALLATQLAPPLRWHRPPRAQQGH
jgi:hypothetical protein